MHPLNEPQIDAILADYLLERENDAGLVPSVFAERLPEPMRQLFLGEIERLGEIDTMVEALPRDLPQRLAGYRILGLLGRGAMGTVYEAEQVSLGRRVAIKVLHDTVVATAGLRARFCREARTVAHLHHPSIVAIHDFHESDGRAFLVMQMAGGRSMQTLLAARALHDHPDHARAVALFDDERRLAACFVHIASALAHAHARGVVHRDIKPANLVVADDGQPYVLDFGLARSADGSLAGLTQDGDVLGTLRYMSPEQLAGEVVGPASDLWSLGCVLLECLTGRSPAGPHTAVPRGRHGALAAIAARCLEPIASRRYHCAEQLVEALDRCAKSRCGSRKIAAAVLGSLRSPRLRVAAIAAGALLCGCLLAPAMAQGELRRVLLEVATRVRLLEQRDSDAVAASAKPAALALLPLATVSESR